jgi:type IV pilus assembly protein PilM
MFGIRFGSKKFLGIDVGTSDIKIVEMGRRGRRILLENYGEVGTSFVKERPFRTFKKDALLLSDKDIARAVQDICQEAGIKTREVNFSIPDFCSFFTSFEMPAMSKEELPEAVRYEVRPYIPLPLSEITLDWLITEGKVSKTPLKILVVAIPNDIISQYQAIANLSNLKLKVLEPEVFSLARALIRNKNAKEKKIIGIVDIGARSTTCSVFEGETLKTSYSFNVAGNELTERLARSLNIEYNKAEELKRKYGLVLKNSGASQPGFPQKNFGGKGKRNIREILIPLIDSILGEIKKAFRGFYQNEGKEVEKIILAGGLALLPGLKEYFFAELKKEVVISNPFLDISYPQILKEVLEKKGPFYAVAVGLALKGLE